jgi:hypothetical protein
MPGVPSKDHSFATWLASNSGQLETLILNSSTLWNTCIILGPLAAAAEAAAAAGNPLPLTTLRVVGKGAVDLPTISRLLKALPHLRVLQLGVSASGLYDGKEEFKRLVQRHLAPLQAASQLEELYLEGADEGDCHSFPANILAQLLPSNLRRLAWQAHSNLLAVPDLSHLTQLTFLRLVGWHTYQAGLTGKLPPALQQLELDGVTLSDEEAEAHQERVTGYVCHYERTLADRTSQFSHLQHTQVPLSGLNSPEARTALEQLIDLFSLKVCEGDSYNVSSRDLRGWVSSVASVSGLRCLHLALPATASLRGLAALSGVTHLTLALRGGPSSTQQQEAAVQELAQMPGLKWLCVPGQLLLAGRPWLGGLQQLQVLLLTGLIPSRPEAGPSVLEQVLQQLERCSPAALPPQLQLLGFTGISAQQAAAAGVRRRLQQRLSSSGCQVVAGPNLQLIWDPAQQLAGLPETLQQALA